MTLPALLSLSCALYGDNVACRASDKPAESFTYAQLCAWQVEVSEFLRQQGIRRGDRVAIWAHNSVRWVAAFWAVTCMGAILVPLLPDFSVMQASLIIRHSGAKLLLVSERIHKRNHGELVHNGQIIIMEHTSEFRDIPPRCGMIGQPGRRQDTRFHVQERDIAVIIYTSGTTGQPKGVMLSHGNLTYIPPRILPIQKIDQYDVFLSVLPLAHIYELVIGMLLPLSVGATVVYLTQQPTPQVLITSLRVVQPSIMLIVPLIIEKIYHNIIYPRLIRHWHIRQMLRVPLLRRWICRKTGSRLLAIFGGRLNMLAIGGAPIDRHTERFLHEARFPYSCGYGLTETSSLIFGAPVGRTRLQSVGPPIADVEYRLEGSDATHPVGEICVRWGGNMRGYYLEPGLTEEVLSADGWLHTGDLGEMRKGYLYLRGRSKTMILGASGENIYPEEIESVLNEMEGVIESLIYQENGRIVGKVYLNPDAAMMHTEAYLRSLRQALNARLSKFAQVSKLIEVFSPFDRTATKKIKR